MSNDDRSRSDNASTVNGAALVGGALLLTERQAARALALSPRMVWSLRKSGKLRFVRIGTAVRYSYSDLQDFVRSQSTTEA